MPFHKILVKALEWHGQISNASEEKNMESSETIPRSHIADVPSSCLRRWTYRRTEERLCPSRCRSDRSSSTRLQFTFISDLQEKINEWWRWNTNRNFLGSLQKGRSTKGNWTTLWSEGKLKHRNILSFQKPGLQNIFRAMNWMTNDNSQLAMLSGQVCSSKGKRARYMGQVQIKETLQQSTRWEMRDENSGTWGWIWCTFPTTLSFSSSPSHIILSPEDRNRDGWLSKMFLSLKKGRRKCGVILLLM